MGIPEFSADGLLPAGVHPATFEDIRARFSFTPQREQIVGNLFEVLSSIPGRAAIKNVLVDGSFVQDKPVPHDVDIVLVIDTTHRDSLSVATWVHHHQLTVKAVKLCHVFVADEQMASDYWIKFFGSTRDARPKGLVRLPGVGV